MRRHYHLPGIVSGAEAVSGGTSRQLVAAVLAGVAQGVRRAAPYDEVTPADHPPREPFTGPPARPAGRYVVPSYDNGGEPVKVRLHRPAIAKAAVDAQEPELFDVDDDLLEMSPDIQVALHSPEMRRYFGLRQLFHQRRGKGQRLQRFPRIWPDQELWWAKQLDYIRAVYDQLQRFDALDWTLLERQFGQRFLTHDWREALENINSFVRGDARIIARGHAASTDAEIAAAHARLDKTAESTAITRLIGAGDLFKAIKYFESIPGGAGGMKLGLDKEGARDRMQRKLQMAKFDDVSEFDAAAGELRQVVRDRAVYIALATLKDSEQVLQAELPRYGDPAHLNKLAGELAPFRRWWPPPEPSYEVAKRKLLVDNPILRDDVAWAEALAGDVPDLIGHHLQARVKHQLGNIERIRAALRENTEEVFRLNILIEETLNQLNLPRESVQALLIREGRAAPGRPVWRWVIDGVLLVLSFASGPLGFAARVIVLGAAIHDSSTRVAKQNITSAGAHAGPTPLADNPVPSGQWLELLGLALAAAGVMLPGSSQRLPTGQALMPATTGKLLTAGTAAEGRTLVAFRPGTYRLDAGGGRWAFGHPDFPDELLIVDKEWLIGYRKVGGVAKETARWPRSVLAPEAVSATPVAQGLVVRPGMVPRTPAQATAPLQLAPPQGTPRPVFQSLGAMARLSPATQAADTRLRAIIQELIERTDKAAKHFGLLAPGGRKNVLLQRTEKLTGELRSYEQRLTVGLSGFKRGLTEPGMDQAVREAVGWVEPKLGSARIRVERLERQMPPVPWPNAAEQTVIDLYDVKLSQLHELQQRVKAGDTAALAQRSAVNDELIKIEQRAARHAPGEENLLFHLETLARARRLLLSQGVDATQVGLRSNVPAAAIMPGGLAHRTYTELTAQLGKPTIVLPGSAMKPGGTHIPPTGAMTLTWKVPGHPGHVIRIDIPVPGSRPFASGNEPHLAWIGPGGVHYSHQGIVVPADSSPAHIPLKNTDALHKAIRAERDARSKAK